MKYDKLMDIPWGYEMQLAEDYSDEYPKGTKVIRGNAEAGLDDEESVSFTFPDGHWDYLWEEQIEEIKKECKGMKGSDKVMVELTGYQVAMIYTILAKSEVNDKAQSYSLFSLLKGHLGEIKAINLPQHKDFPQYIPFNLVADSVYKAVLEPETPVLAEAQKKALELKETIAKAQKQLEELEKEMA